MNTNHGKILITGDFCPVNRIEDLASRGDCTSIFNDFLPIIKENNLAITNLECPLTDTKSRIEKSGPLLKASIKTIKALSCAGFNLVTLANNHIMDYGIVGMKSTLQACENSGIDHVGAGEDYIRAREIYYTKVGGQTVAILNFTENEFSTTSGNYPGANPLDPIENYRDISMAKAKADYVIVIVHGGHEMYDLPSPRIKNTFHFYVDAGANAIFGHHAHCYSGYEVYKGSLIFYGLGNFIFDNLNRNKSSWNTGYAVELIFNNTIKYNIIPYEQCNQSPGVKLMSDQDRMNFYDNISRLNSIILDNKLLNNEFDKYCKRVMKMYLSFIEPHSILFLHYLRNRNLFPSLLSRRKKTLYLNLMRCESHRDILIKTLNI